MKYFSLFSGIGGFELGLIKAYVAITNRNSVRKGETHQKKNDAGGQRLESQKGKGAGASGGLPRQLLNRHNDPRAPHCVGYSEIDKYAIKIYEKYFKHKNFGDITTIDVKKVPDFDLLVGGFPCQSFSIAGKRRGFKDTRGTLFFEISRILRHKKPRLCLLENVKGLLSHDNGRTFRIIISELIKLGYDVQWQVLNSKDFGVPQNRERVFIVGHLRETSRPEIFPLAGYYSQDDYLQPEENQQRSRIPCLSTRYGQRWSDEGYIATDIRKINNPTHSNNRIYRSDGISPTLNTAQGGNRQPKISHRGMKIRRLTPLECERLQSFPDGWTEGVSDTQRYKTIGNAVTVNVVEAIAEKLLIID